MSVEHPNAATARELWTAIAEADSAALCCVLTPDVVWHSHGQNLLAGRHRGHDGVIDYLRRAGELSDDLRSTLRQVYAGDDGAVLCYHVSAKRGVKSLEMEIVIVLTIREGKVVAVESVPMEQHESDRFWI